MSAVRVDPMPQRFTFAEHLARQRIAVEKTQGDVADELTSAGFKTRSQSVSAWERGEYKPSDLAIVVELERILDCPGELIEALGASGGGPSRLAAMEQRIQDLERQQAETLTLIEAATKSIQALSNDLRPGP